MPSLRAARFDERVAASTFYELPLRVILALVVIGAFGGIAVGELVAVLRAERLNRGTTDDRGGRHRLVIALLAMWVIFLRPAYWD
jgi:hypothetical protein